MSYRGGKWRKQERDKPDTPSPPYGELLVELNQHDISESSFSPKIADCEYVASYSWLQSVSPTIIVPGIIADRSFIIGCLLIARYRQTSSMDATKREPQAST